MPDANSVTIAKGGQIAALEQAAHDARGTDAANTLRTYGAGVRRFVAWSDENGLPYDFPRSPVDPRTLADFVDDLAETLAPATIATYTHAVNRMHTDLDLPPPIAARVVKQALKRMRRAKGTKQKQATPMRRDTIDKALNGLGDSLTELRDAALVALAYDTLCRASELVALNLSDVSATPDGATVFIAKSKTDQEGQGQERFVGPDTLRRIEAWASAAHLAGDDPLFPSLGHAARSERISTRDVSRIYKRRVGRAYSGHSTRVGAAVDQRAASLPTGLIAQSGGWKSETMVLRYTAKVAAQESGAAKLARMQGRFDADNG